MGCAVKEVKWRYWDRGRELRSSWTNGGGWGGGVFGCLECPLWLSRRAEFVGLEGEDLVLREQGVDRSHSGCESHRACDDGMEEEERSTQR